MERTRGSIPPASEDGIDALHISHDKIGHFIQSASFLERMEPSVGCRRYSDAHPEGFGEMKTVGESHRLRDLIDGA